jgi:ABC-2 type transport system ATP-binding protein
VDDLTIEVARGSVFGFLGPNGAGKTTTIRMLLGVLEPTRGHAEVAGFDPHTHGTDVRRRAGAVLEHPGLYERLTASENLEFFGRAWRMPARDRRERAQVLLTRLGLWDRRNDRVKTWSRGMRQRLAIVRALLPSPEVLFLDEPTVGLDPVAAAELRDELAALVRDEDVTVFLTTHNLSEAEQLCARVALVHEGKLVAEDTPAGLRAGVSAPRVEVVGSGFDAALLDRLRARPEVTSVTATDGHLEIDLDRGRRVAPLVRLLVESGAEVEEVRKVQASFEEAFIHLMREQES